MFDMFRPTLDNSDSRRQGNDQFQRHTDRRQADRSLEPLKQRKNAGGRMEMSCSRSGRRREAFDEVAELYDKRTRCDQAERWQSLKLAGA